MKDNNKTKNKNYNSKKEQTRKSEINQQEKQNFDDQVEGRNSVLELLESGKDINKIFITKGEKHGSINKIIAKAKENGIIIVEKDKNQMRQMAQNENYQGVIAIVPPYEYCEIEDILEEASKKSEDAFVLILDGIEDPHNLGSIMRTADAAGVHGIIIPKRRAVQLTSVVAKTSTGAIEHVPVVRVTNLVQTVKELKEQGVWIFGTDMKGTDFRKWSAKGATALVIGNEGKGISPLLKKTCDEMLTIPMVGHVQSLNASVAASLLIYQGFTSRGN